jgi:hypothetical protein
MVSQTKYFTQRGSIGHGSFACLQGTADISKEKDWKSCMYEYKGTNPDRFAFVLFFMPFETDWSGMPLQMFERAPSG